MFVHFVFYFMSNFYIFLIKKQTLNIANCFTLVSTCASVAAAWAISYNGLPWAWASPCSSGCSNIDISLSSGYSYATASEYANKPSDSDFSTSDSGNTYYYSGVKCDANFFFDTSYIHCDPGTNKLNILVCNSDNDAYELLVVRGLYSIDFFVHIRCNIIIVENWMCVPCIELLNQLSCRTD
jgi:hypothetical protein